MGTSQPNYLVRGAIWQHRQADSFQQGAGCSAHHQAFVMTTPQDSDITRFDRFELLEKVGEGGFGSVYKARHRFLEQTFALKVLPPTLQSDEEAMRRFEREVRALRNLDHT